MTDYLKVLSEAFDSLLEYGLSADGWRPVSNSKGVAIFKKAGEDSINIIRGVGLIKASAEKILEAIKDNEKFKKWDENLDTAEVIEQINDDARIGHFIYKPVWPTSSRDFCVVSGHQKRDDGTFVAVSKSVEHPKCPPVEGRVRADLLGGFILKPVTDGYEVTYAVKLNLKGKIPTVMINKVNENVPMVIPRLRDLVQE